MNSVNMTFKNSVEWYVQRSLSSGADCFECRLCLAAGQTGVKDGRYHYGGSHSLSLPRTVCGEFLRSLFDSRTLGETCSSVVHLQQYVRCTRVEHESRVAQTFYDVPLQVRNSANSTSLASTCLPERNVFSLLSYGEFSRFL